MSYSRENPNHVRFNRARRALREAQEDVRLAEEIIEAERVAHNDSVRFLQNAGYTTDANGKELREQSR